MCITKQINRMDLTHDLHKNTIQTLKRAICFIYPVTFFKKYIWTKASTINKERNSFITMFPIVSLTNRVLVTPSSPHLIIIQQKIKEKHSSHKIIN